MLFASAVEQLDRYAGTPRRRGRLSLERAREALLTFRSRIAQKEEERGALFIELLRRGHLGNWIAIGSEKGRGVENPGGKTGWALYRRGVTILPACYRDHTAWR